MFDLRRREFITLLGGAATTAATQAVKEFLRGPGGGLALVAVTS